MSIVYAVRLVTSEGSDASADLRSAVQLASAWAGIDDPFAGVEQTGRKNGRVSTGLHQAHDGSAEAWTLRLHHPDEREPSVRWGTYITAFRAESLDVRIELDRTRVDGNITRIDSRPAPPRLVADLLDSSIEFLDGGQRLKNDVMVVRGDEAGHLAALVMAADRHLPLIGFTGREEDPVDAETIIRSIRGLAHLAFVDEEASWRLDDLLPEGLNVYGGAARLWWPGIPGVPSHNEKWNHPLWTGSTPSWRVRQEVVERVLDASLSSWMQDVRVLRLRQDSDRARSLARDREIERLREEVRGTENVDSANVGTDQRASAIETRDRLDELTFEQIRELREERDIYMEMATDREDRLSEALEQIRQRDIDLGRLTSELEEARERRRARSAVEAFEDDLRAEINSRHEMTGAFPRAFTVGPHFIDHVEGFGPSYRPKILRACADVVINAPELLARRTDKDLKTGDGPHDPVRTRLSDGATARRCYIENNTSSARRLHYWSIDPRTIEFANVVHHDNMSIPE